MPMPIIRYFYIIFFAGLLLAATRLPAQDTVVPASLQVPAGNRLFLHVYAKGVQLYRCTRDRADSNKFSWVNIAPVADLYTASDYKTIAGKHYAGPTWEAKDGSRVVGKAVATVPSPDAHSVPWLRLDAIRHEGNGTMSQVLSIQRLNTKGGKAPVNGCDSSHTGSEARAPYEAEYYFYGNR